MSYTYVFGVLSAYLLLSSGHVVASIAGHMLCNAIGFPDLDAVVSADRGWRIVYVGAYVLGLTAFLAVICTN